MPDVLERETTVRSDWKQEGEGQALFSKALMGAAAGAAGTWALDRADWRMWNNESEEARLKTTAARPGGEPPAHVLVSSVEQAFGLNLTPEQHHAAGIAVHYGIGIAPAVAYSIFRDQLPGRGPLRGALYGLGLFLLQDELLNTATGLGADPRRYPWQAHARGLVSHLVYGVVTEMVLNFIEDTAQQRRSAAEV